MKTGVVGLPNLDYLCMKCSQELSAINDSALESNLRKALGILREDGVYAMFLWLENKDNSKEIIRKLVELLNEDDIKKILITTGSFPQGNFKDLCLKLREVAQNIDKLLFVKKVLERTLTYGAISCKNR